MILLIPRQAGKNAAGKSSMVSPSPLQGFLRHGFLNLRQLRGQPLASCYLRTEQIVTGLSLPPVHRSNRGNDHPFHGGKQFTQYPDCAGSGVRLPSIKNCNAARDVTKCHSYNVVTQGGRKGDRPIDTLHSGDLVEKLNEIDYDMASRDAHYPDQSRLKEGSYTIRSSSTSRDSKLAQFIDYQTPSLHHQSDQQPLSTGGHSLRGTNTKSCDMMYPLSMEELIMVRACGHFVNT